MHGLSMAGLKGSKLTACYLDVYDSTSASREPTQIRNE